MHGFKALSNSTIPRISENSTIGTKSTFPFQKETIPRPLSLDHPLPRAPHKTLKSRPWCILGRRADPKYGAIYLTGSSARQAPTQNPKVPRMVYPRTTTGPQVWRNASHWIIRSRGLHAKPYSSRHGVSQGDEQTSSMARCISLDHPLPNPRRKNPKVPGMVYPRATSGP